MGYSSPRGNSPRPFWFLKRKKGMDGFYKEIIDCLKRLCVLTTVHWKVNTLNKPCQRVIACELISFVVWVQSTLRTLRSSCPICWEDTARDSRPPSVHFNLSATILHIDCKAIKILKLLAFDIHINLSLSFQHSVEKYYQRATASVLSYRRTVNVRSEENQQQRPFQSKRGKNNDDNGLRFVLCCCLLWELHYRQKAF